MKRGIRALGIVLALLGVVMVAGAALEALRVDRCLDAGGSFDYVTGICDRQQSHPHRPRRAVSPWMVGSLMFVAGVASLTFGRKRVASLSESSAADHSAAP